MEHKTEATAGGTGYIKIFPTRLRYLLKETGNTQAALAKHLGIARQSVAAYCSGESTPSWEGIVGIARFFDCSSDYLLGLSENKEPQNIIPGLRQKEVNALRELLKEKLLQWAQGQEGDSEQARLLTGIYLKL